MTQDAIRQMIEAQGFAVPYLGPLDQRAGGSILVENMRSSWRWAYRIPIAVIADACTRHLGLSFPVVNARPL